MSWLEIWSRQPSSLINYICSLLNKVLLHFMWTRGFPAPKHSPVHSTDNLTPIRSDESCCWNVVVDVSYTPVLQGTFLAYKDPKCLFTVNMSFVWNQFSLYLITSCRACVVENLHLTESYWSLIKRAELFSMTKLIQVSLQQ